MELIILLIGLIDSLCKGNILSNNVIIDDEDVGAIINITTALIKEVLFCLCRIVGQSPKWAVRRDSAILKINYTMTQVAALKQAGKTIHIWFIKLSY